MAKFCGRLLWMAPNVRAVKNAVQLRDNVLKNYVAIDLRGGGSS